MKETQVQSLGGKDSLEKGMATHSSILAWEIQWTEEPSGLQPLGSQRVEHNLVTNRQKMSLRVPWANDTEKAMAPHSSTLAWKIPWMEEPGRLHAVHGVAKSRARLSDFTFAFHFHALEKEMATHSSILAWRIPETEEPSGLPSMGSHRAGHDWSDLAAAVAVCIYIIEFWFAVTLRVLYSSLYVYMIKLLISFNCILNTLHLYFPHPYNYSCYFTSSCLLYPVIAYCG